MGMFLDYLLKSRQVKYIKRWRGADGKWKYKYPSKKKGKKQGINPETKSVSVKKDDNKKGKNRPLYDKRVDKGNHWEYWYKQSSGGYKKITRKKPTKKQAKKINEKIKVIKEKATVENREKYKGIRLKKEEIYKSDIMDEIFDAVDMELGAKLHQPITKEPLDKKSYKKIKTHINNVMSVFNVKPTYTDKHNLTLIYSDGTYSTKRNIGGVFEVAGMSITIFNKTKNNQLSFAHEFAHFLDYTLPSNKNFASNEKGSVANKIAEKVRELMIPPYSWQRRGYLKRNIECFARALEQYFEIKQRDGKYVKRDKIKVPAFQSPAHYIGGYVDEDVYKKEIMPMVENFLNNNKKLLKSLTANLFKKR